MSAEKTETETALGSLTDLVGLVPDAAQSYVDPDGVHRVTIIGPVTHRLRCGCGWISKGSWHSMEGAEAAARMHESGRDVEGWCYS